MRKKHLPSYTFSRSDFVFAVFVATSAIFIVKLFTIQVSRHEVLAAQATKQYQNLQQIQAKRGNIYTRDMYPLAATQKAYLMFFEPKLVSDFTKTSQAVSKILAEGDSKLFESYNSRFLDLLKLDLYWVAAEHEILPETKNKLEELNIKGVGFEEEPIRFYPEKRLASHVLGYVAKKKAETIQGYFGVEGYFNGDLQGKPGRVVQERDATGSPILVGKYKKDDPINGTDIVLTLDRSIQYMVEKKLIEGVKKYEADFGSVIVMDALTGQILALANYPDYDPSNLTFNEEKKDMYSDQKINFAVSEVYEPGSVIKALTVSSGIDTGVISPNTTFTDAGPVNYSDYTIDNWDGKHHGIQTITELLQKSNNIGSSWVAHQVGGKNLYKYFRSFGLGSRSGIELEGEDSGFLKAEDSLTAIDLATSGFGQGMSATPLQVLNAFNTIANDGILLRPRIVMEMREDGRVITLSTKPVKRVMSKDSADTVERMLEEAAVGGESKYFVLKNYRIAGKTGTAQIPKDGKYDPNETNATFVGYLSGEKKISMLVKLNRPKTSPYAAETAVPMWMDIATEMIKYYGIAPDRL